ncbi:MAG: RDD family protein, partial [Gammaproteobacteria bacterium]
MTEPELEYVGFWPRVGAAIIDTLLLGMITWPLLTAIYGKSYWSSDSFIKGPADFLVSWVFPAVAVIAFW